MMQLVLAALLNVSPVAKSGQLLYEVHCSSCHGLSLQGSLDGPPLLDVTAGEVDFMLQTGRMPAASLAGAQLVQQHPQFSQLNIRAITSYVTSRADSHSQLPSVGPGRAEHGRELFAENCQQCHGVSAHGASVGYGDVAPSLMHTHSQQIAEAIRMGPGQMPRFGPDVLSQRDLDDVVAYITFLRRGKSIYNPGGLQLANIGPVAEGFVAWVFGLGAVVLFMRRIGSTD